MSAAYDRGVAGRRSGGTDGAARPPRDPPARRVLALDRLQTAPPTRGAQPCANLVAGPAEYAKIIRTP